MAGTTADGPASVDLKPPYREFSVGMGRLADADLDRVIASVSAMPRLQLDAGSPCAPDEICKEVQRCARCDCAASETCLLRRYSGAYGAKSTTWRGARRVFEPRLDHPEIVLESGKCIGCGLCVQAAERAGERIGLVMENRGFGLCVAVPFGHSVAEGLETSALDCVEICPTGAFARRR